MFLHLPTNTKWKKCFNKTLITSKGVYLPIFLIKNSQDWIKLKKNGKNKKQ